MNDKLQRVIDTMDDIYEDVIELSKFYLEHEDYISCMNDYYSFMCWLGVIAKSKEGSYDRH